MDNVTFCIRNDDLGESNNSPFDLIPLDKSVVEFRTKAIKAQLKQGEKLVLNATFAPKKPGIYKAEVPIFIRGYSNGLVYNYINLYGELKRPTLIANAKEVTQKQITKSRIYFVQLPYISLSTFIRFIFPRCPLMSDAKQ